MERVLSNDICDKLVEYSKTQKWERVETVGHYDQVFIYDKDLESILEEYFGKSFLDTPIVKVCRFEKGDYIATSTFDYSKASDEQYKRYAKTNFVIQIYLNDSFEGGNLSSGPETYDVVKGYGITQNRSTKCSLRKITDGVGYYLFVFISGYKSNNLL